MRLTLAILAILTLYSPAAWSAGTLPHFRKDTPYAQVRAGMIAAGFRPLRILKRPPYSSRRCEYDLQLCTDKPEVMDCSASGPCTYLYERVSDRALVILHAYSEGHCPYIGMGWATADDFAYDGAYIFLREYVSAAPGSKTARPKR